MILITQQYSDSRGEHIVHLGKLIFIKDAYPEWDKGLDYRPVIISETEEIELGDWVYSYKTREVIRGKFNCGPGNIWAKVLALPEHFSDKHLQAIADGKMKDGDEVLVKCEYNIGNFSHYSQDLVKVAVYKNDGYIVYLNQQNHITLFPAKQSLEEAAEEYQDKLFRSTEWLQYSKQLIEKSFKAGAEWAKSNNY